MNRKGFTAIMDATFFIILIGIAVTVLTQIGSDEDDYDSGLSDAIDTLMSANLSAEELGYDDERVMAMTDLAALSILSEDGVVIGYLAQFLDILYPWDSAYGIILNYAGRELAIGQTGVGWQESALREYNVQYGGTLAVRINLYG